MRDLALRISRAGAGRWGQCSSEPSWEGPWLRHPFTTECANANFADGSASGSSHEGTQTRGFYSATPAVSHRGMAHRALKEDVSGIVTDPTHTPPVPRIHSLNMTRGPDPAIPGEKHIVRRADACAASTQHRSSSALSDSGSQEAVFTHSQIRQRHGVSAMVHGPAHSMLGLSAAVSQPHVQEGGQDERQRMRDKARRLALAQAQQPQAQQATSGAAQSQSWAATSLAEDSPLFHMAPSVRSWRKGRPFEPYIPPVQWGRLQQPGLVCRLLGGSPTATSTSPEDERPGSHNAYSLRHVSEPCTLALSVAPELSTAAQYMHVRPVCQHATWNLSASSLLGQMPPDRLKALVASMRASLGLSDSDVPDDHGQEVSDNVQASGIHSSTNNCHTATGGLAQPQAAGESSERGAAVAWVAAARGRKKRAPDHEHNSQGTSASNKGTVQGPAAAKWAWWRRAVGVAQALYATQFIHKHGRTPQIVAGNSTLTSNTAQSPHQDSAAAEVMLNAYFESRSWQQAQIAAQAMHARAASLQSGYAADPAKADAAKRELLRERKRRQQELEAGARGHHRMAGDSLFALDSGGSLAGSTEQGRLDGTGFALDDRIEMLAEEAAQEDEEQEHGGGHLRKGAHASEQYKSLDLAVLDNLWNQAVAAGVVGMASGDAGGEAPAQGGRRDTGCEHTQHTAHSGRTPDGLPGGAMRGSSFDFDSLVRPPEWDSFQQPVQGADAVTHGSNALDEDLPPEPAAAAMDHEARTPGQHFYDENYDDDDDVSFGHENEDEQEQEHLYDGQGWAPQLQVSDDPFDLERMHGGLSPSLDGLGMAPHDVGLDALHPTFSSIGHSALHSGDEAGPYGGPIGGFEPLDYGSPSRQHFSALP